MGPNQSGSKTRSMLLVWSGLGLLSFNQPEVFDHMINLDLQLYDMTLSEFFGLRPVTQTRSRIEFFGLRPDHI